MWIWQVRKSSGGDAAAMVARARRYGIETIVIKGADARTVWGQFSPALIYELKAAGLRVCAYQFVYGRHPRGEAAAGARLAGLGADCLLVDAEGQYEGRYAQAQTYMRALRARVGPSYPIGLAGFPYVGYHPAFPYSVFLGPDGAQFNVPQMYWKTIGTTVDRVFAVTYRYNRVWGRPIEPLGQVYDRPGRRAITRFRQLAYLHGAPGSSWWSWQSASTPAWQTVGAFVEDPFELVQDPGYPKLRRRMRGDLVVWAQEHLISAGVQVPVDGIFGRRLEAAVRDFQVLEGLPPVGRIGPRTWQALLRYPAARVRWTRRGALAAAAGGRTGPPSARLPAVRNELGPRQG